MKNDNHNGKLRDWHQSEYQPEWTIDDVHAEMVRSNAPGDAKFYTHTDKDVDPHETQLIFNWASWSELIEEEVETNENR